MEQCLCDRGNGYEIGLLTGGFNGVFYVMLVGESVLYQIPEEATIADTVKEI